MSADDVLTSAHITNAMRALVAMERRQPVRYIHPKDHHHITVEHPKPVLDCARCRHAWATVG